MDILKSVILHLLNGIDLGPGAFKIKISILSFKIFFKKKFTDLSE